MDRDDVLRDAFASDDLWKSSSYFNDPADYETSLFAPLQLDVPSIKFHHPYAPKATLDRELRLPDIDQFEFGPLPELESLDESSVSIETPPTEPEEDVWQIAFELGPATKDVVFFTWEAFEAPGRVELRTPYITDSGPEAFDAALAKDAGKIAPGRVVTGHILLESLWNLGLGRSSILFAFNAKLRSFEPAILDGRASGISLRASQSLVNQFIHAGNTFLYLRSFVERTLASTASTPARVALATSVSSILSTFEDHLGRYSGEIKSLLQLQSLFARPREILNHIARTVDAVKHAKTNEQISSILHHRILAIEEGDESICQLSCEILRRVANPSLELLGEWVGIQNEQQTGPMSERVSFVAVDESSEHQGQPEYVYRSEMMPRFIAPEDGNLIFETGNSLRFLKMHHPEHPLVAPEKFGVQPLAMQWEFGWQEIELISEKAKAYEQQLQTTILKFTQGRIAETPSTHIPGTYFEDGSTGTDYKRDIEDAIHLFDGVPKQPLSHLPDDLQILTEQILADSSTSNLAQSHTFSPPISLTSALSFRPLLTAQAKLVNAATLRLFFRSHQLRLHLSLQRQYQLLGDGVFSSRLASALFDPERESAERHKGKMRSGVHMGLQLGSRDSWPPASSELRLALMGVLSESFYESSLYHSTQQDSTGPDHRRDKGELPGQLNFSIRTLTEREMEKVMDPYALYALDFLRLQYVSPSPLNLVITSSSLDKYDYIFKFLLRLLRMLFVVAHLPRTYSDSDSRRFRMEAHHFVTALSTYIFQTGIQEHWDAFQAYATTLETRLAEEDDKEELGTRVTDGLASLRTAHAHCLDSILFSLLLRKRQRQVMELVEDIFSNILLFAKMHNPDAHISDSRKEGEKEKESVKELYTKFRGKIKVFLSVIRKLTGKKGYGKGRGTTEENTVERLGVLLEMNAYFGTVQ